MVMGRWTLCWAAAGGLLLATGCMVPDVQPPRTGLGLTDPSAAEPGSPDLSPKQVADVQIGLGRTLENSGDQDAALRAYREAVARDPRRADACSRLAVLLDRQGQAEEAAQWHQKAVDLEPDNPDLLCNLGYALTLRQQFDAAEAPLVRAVRLRPDHTRAHANLALVLGHQGRSSEALLEFQKAGLTPAQAHANLGYVCTLRGDWNEARTHYEASLAAEPGSRTARRGLERVASLAARFPPDSPGRDRAQVAAAPSNP